MSGSIATIDVVGAHDHPDELLGDKVHFVGGFGATENPESLVAIFLAVLGKPLRDPVKRFVPGCRTKCSVFPNQGGGKADSSSARIHCRHDQTLEAFQPEIFGQD
jgi:hypothetical protein